MRSGKPLGLIRTMMDVAAVALQANIPVMLPVRPAASYESPRQRYGHGGRRYAGGRYKGSSQAKRATARGGNPARQA